MKKSETANTQADLSRDQNPENDTESRDEQSFIPEKANLDRGSLSDSQTLDDKSRKQDLEQEDSIRKPSYISGLLAEVLPDDNDQEDADDDDELKPIKRQNYYERVASLKAVEGDLQSYFENRSSRKFVFGKGKEKSSLDTQLTVLTPTVDDEDDQGQAHYRKGSKTLQQLSSSWSPAEHRDKRKDSGIRKTSKNNQSWVGSYSFGQDYWSPIPEGEEETTPKQVQFSVDAEHEKSWYAMPLNQMPSEVKQEKEEEKSKVKQEWIQNIQEKKKGRDSRDIVAVPVEYSSEFQSRFQNYARGNDFSADGSCMSVPNSDKWLERASILDYHHVTLIHTGFCFQAAGGGKYKGLKIDQFLHYLKILAGITDIAFANIVDSMSGSPMLDENKN